MKSLFLAVAVATVGLGTMGVTSFAAEAAQPPFSRTAAPHDSALDAASNRAVDARLHAVLRGLLVNASK